jgi:hypothetical protein
MEQLPKEVEVYLSTLIRLGMGEADEDGNKKEVIQPWFRVLALEITRGSVSSLLQLLSLRTPVISADGQNLRGCQTTTKPV